MSQKIGEEYSIMTKIMMTVINDMKTDYQRRKKFGNDDLGTMIKAVVIPKKHYSLTNQQLNNIHRTDISVLQPKIIPRSLANNVTDKIKIVELEIST